MRSLISFVLPIFSLIAGCPAQRASTTAVSNLINYTGTLVLSSGVRVSTKTVGVTFAICRQHDG